MHLPALVVLTAVILLAAFAAAAHLAVRRVRSATGLPSPLAVLRRHPDARLEERQGKPVAFIPGQTEGLAFDDLAVRCWKMLDGRRSLVSIAQEISTRSGVSTREALSALRAFARTLKQSLLALEDEEWRLVHVHRHDLFEGASDEQILEQRPSEDLVVHAARCILSPEGDLEPWRGSWWERRRAARALERHARRERPLRRAGEMFRRGWELIRQGAVEGAEAAFDRATRLAPEWVKPHYELGYVRLRLGRYEDAAASLRRADELKPGYYMVREFLDHARRLQEGQLRYEAFDLFDRANAAGLENPDTAIQLASRALEISPDFPSARLVLARAYQQKKQLDRALGELHRTIQMNPDQATLCHALLSRGAIFHAQGRTDQAVREWEKVIQINGSRTATRSAVETLASTTWTH